MKYTKTSIGIFDSYNNGRVVHIDFTYCDHIIIWVQYKTKTISYLWRG